MLQILSLRSADLLACVFDSAFGGFGEERARSSLTGGFTGGLTGGSDRILLLALQEGIRFVSLTGGSDRILCLVAECWELHFVSSVSLRKGLDLLR